MHHHLWSETRQTGYSVGVTIRLEPALSACARFGQENGASEGETLEQPRDERSSGRNYQKPPR